MALSGVVFQRSNNVRLNTAYFQDAWTTENQLQKFVLSEGISGRSRMCRAIIRNPHSINEDAYFIMQRVRVLDKQGVVLFLGRVGQIEPDYESGSVLITCVDYMSDLSDVTVEADEYAGIYSGMSTKYLVDQIMYNETFRDLKAIHPGNSSISVPTDFDYGTLDHALIGGVQVDPSTYGERISRKYSNRGSFYDGRGYSTDPFKYEYRGVKTGFEAIGELAGSDSQQDLMVMSLASETVVNPETSSETAQGAFWRDWTASAQEGTENFIPLFNTSAYQYLFIGSNSKFDGIEYTFRQRGSKIEGSSLNTMYWEYWNGSTWVSFDPGENYEDDKFGYDPSALKQNYGRTMWAASYLRDWTKRDLGASPDLFGGTIGSNNPTFIWQEGTGNASGRDRNDTTHAGSYKLEGDFVQGDGLTDTTIGTRHGLVDSTYRYWIRVSTNGVTSRGYLSTLKPYTRRTFGVTDVDGVKEYFHAVRAEDPTYFEEIWKYTTPATNNGRDGAGGTWLSLNTTGGNDGSGKRLLWDSSDPTGSATFLDSVQEDWHFGNDAPISGIELHAVQGSYIPIEAIGTGATVSITTVHAHGLSVGDRILIDQTDSVPSMDTSSFGLLVAGVTNTTTVTVASSGASAMSGSDPVRIAGTTGRIITGIPDYTNANVNWYMHRTDRVQGDPHGQGASTSNRGWDLVNTTSGNQDNNNNSSVYGTTKTHGLEGLGYAMWLIDKGAEGSTPHWYSTVHFNMHFNHNGIKKITNGPGGVSGQTYLDIRAATGTSTVTIKTKVSTGAVLLAAVQQTGNNQDVIEISNTAYPDTPGFAAGDQILIDSEVLSIASVSGSDYTCNRAQDSTSNAAHNIRSVIYKLKHGFTTGDHVLIDRSNTGGNSIDTGSQSIPVTRVDDYSFTIIPPNGAINSNGTAGRVVTGIKSLNSEFENNNFHSITPYDDRVSAYVGAATSPADDADFSIGKRTVLGGSPVIASVARVAVDASTAGATLSAGIDNNSSTTTVPVTIPEIGLSDLEDFDPHLPLVLTRDILIGSEQMRVTAIEGGNLTVVRAINSTSIGSHSLGAAISYYRTRFTTTNAHLLKVGDEVTITNSLSNPNYDGVYTILAVPSGTTFDIVDQGVLTASGAANCTAFSPPPNGKSLFWLKAHSQSGTPVNKANIVAIRTAGNQAHLKYFAKGKEPWSSNILYSADGSAATRDLDYLYTYDETAAEGGPHLLLDGVGQSIETRLGSDVAANATTVTLSSAPPYPVAYALLPDGTTYTSVGTSLEIFDPVEGTREIMQVLGKPSGNVLTVARGKDGTTAVAHEADTSVVSNYVKGKNQVTRYASANTFRIKSISQARLASGVATIAIVVGLEYDAENRYITQSFPLQSGDSVTLSGISDDADTGVGTDLNGVGKIIFDVQVSEGTGTASFRISHDEATTKRGTSGLVTVNTVKLYTSTSAQTASAGNNDGDAVYFGSKHPFTQLRFDLKTKPVITTQNDRYVVQWEYFTSNGTSGAYDWRPLTNHGLYDGTNSFNSTGFREVHWSMPTDWRPCQPTVINPTSRLIADRVSPQDHSGTGWLSPESGTMFDWRGGWGAGKTAFYVRARLVNKVGTGNGPILSQVWCGPNHWNPVSLDVETLGLGEGESHADPRKYALTLHQTAHGSDHVEQITSYSVGDKPFEFVNKVVVRGADGAYGVAKDENSMQQYGTTKEKVVHSSAITNSVQAEQLAVKLLHQLKPFSEGSVQYPTSNSVVSSIRECHVSTRYWPCSYNHKKPRPLRAGDVVNVVISDKNILNERWMVSQIEYDALEGDVDMILHRDLDRITEVGPANQRAIRDLMGRTRELSRATFTTMDTTVESGIDFMPEGPSRTIARMSYDPIGTYPDVTTDGATAKVDNDNYRWNLKLYDDYNSKNADRVQLRIDHKGARPDLNDTQLSQYTQDGAGIGYIGRIQRGAYNVNDQSVNKNPITNSASRGTTDQNLYFSSVRDHFYPQAGEATVYLRKTLDGYRRVGSGLYIAHRGIWNDDDYGSNVSVPAADGSTFPIQLHHEVFVGVSGVILYDTSAATKAVHDILPDLIDKPMVFLQVAETTSEGNMAESTAPTTTFQKVTASVRSWQTNGESGADIRYRGFNISLYKAGADGETGLVVNDVTDIPVMYLVVFNSSRDQRYSADHLA